MKLGIGGFVGARLVEAREARGLTVSALANLIEVSRQQVYKYEQGKDSPGQAKMERICDVLNLPLVFFQRSHGYEPAPTFFRSLKRASDIERARAKRLLGWLPLITDYVGQPLELPAVQLPRLGRWSDPGALSDDDVERLAVETRRFLGFGDGPISNIVWLLENKGVVVGCESLCDDIDALSGWVGDRPYMVLGNDRRTAARSRFDAAHELGHLLLHCHIDDATTRKSDALALAEHKAHRFAAAFAFPKSSFALESHPMTLDHFVELKKKWKMSVKMMIYRAGELGFISERQQKDLRVGYAKRKWHLAEPLDDVIPVERPRLLQRSIDMLVREGARSRADVMVGTTLGRGDVERLSVLPNMYLSDHEAEVINIEPMLRSRSTPPPAALGNVIQFPRPVNDR